MRLPGGVWHNDALHRSFAFRSLTGNLELSVAEIAESGACLPLKVTTALSASLAHIGTSMPDQKNIEALCVADRQFLMRCLSGYLGMGKIWLTADCIHCGERFDFFLDQSGLPVKNAGKGFPFVSVDTSLGSCRFRVPNGSDQVAIVTTEDNELARQTLIYRCLDELPNDLQGEVKGQDIVEEFSMDDIVLIEQAIEEVAAEVSTLIQAVCPECKQNNIVEIDPYMCLQRGSSELLSEIHILAINYHWSETEILAMPKKRRQCYLRLIDTTRDMMQ